MKISQIPEDISLPLSQVKAPKAHEREKRIQELVAQQSTLASSLDLLSKPGSEQQIPSIVQIHKDFIKKLQDAIITETIDASTLQTILRSALKSVVDEQDDLHQTSYSDEPSESIEEELQTTQLQIESLQTELQKLKQILNDLLLPHTEIERNTLLQSNHLPIVPSLNEALGLVQGEIAKFNRTIKELEVKQLQLQGQLVQKSTLLEINAPDSDGLTHLTRAVAMGSESLISYLIITCHANPNARDAKGKTPLQYAAESQKPELFKLLISLGADVNMTDAEGYTFLTRATEQGKDELVKFLITDCHVNPNARDAKGKTPLQYAAESQKPELFKLLISLGADVNMPDAEGYTFLTRATEQSKDDLVQFLITDCHANPNAVDGNKETALSLAYKAKNNNMGALLLRLGADCSANDGNGYNLLTKAAELGDLETVRILIRDFKINPNINDARGHSALTRATAANKQNVIEFLIDDSNMDPNENDDKGWSPLKIAAEMRNFPLMQLLVSQGTDPLPYLTKNNELQNNLCSGLNEMYSSGEHLNLHDVKSRYNIPESVPETKEHIIKYLQEQLQESCFTHHMLSILTSDYSPNAMATEPEKTTSPHSPIMELRLVHEASERLNSHFQDLLQTLKRLTQEKFSPEELSSLAQVKDISLDPSQISLSHMLERTQEKIKQLHFSIEALKKTGEELQQQITFNIQQGTPPRDENKLNLVTYAIATKNKILITFLADTHEDLSSPDPEGYTPLERAVMAEDTELFDLLVEKGADVTRSDREGFTLTTRAASAGRLPLLQYFSDKHKIDLSSPDSEGRTPYSEAVKTQQHDVIQYLHEKRVVSAPPAFPARPPEPKARLSPPYFFRPYHFHGRPPIRPFLSPRPRRPKKEVPQQPLQDNPPAVLQPAQMSLPPPVLPPPPVPPQQEPIAPVLRHINFDDAPDIHETPTAPTKEGWGAWFIKIGATALGGTLNILGQTGGVIWNYGRQFVKRPIKEEPQTHPETSPPHPIAEPPATPAHFSPLLPGQRIITKIGKKGPKKLRLEVIKFLSEGTFKKVYKAHTFKSSGEGHPKLKAYAEPTHPTAAPDLLHDCAISKLFRDQLGIREIVKIREVHSSTGVGALMEFCDQGDFFNFLQKEKNPITRMTLALEFTNGLAKMHARQYCHLDLKLLNILVKTEADGQPHIRIGDLGTCQPTHIGKRARMTPLCGTYPAPEINASKQQNHEVPVSPALDLWVLGDILYSVKYGQSPLERFGLSHAAIGKPEFLTKVQTLQQHVESLALHSHDPLDRCIADLFSSDPARRPPATFVAQKIQEWIQRQQPH